MILEIKLVVPQYPKTSQKYTELFPDSEEFKYMAQPSTVEMPRENTTDIKVFGDAG